MLPVEIVQSIEKLPEQGFNGVLIKGMVSLVPMMSNDFLKKIQNTSYNLDMHMTCQKGLSFPLRFKCYWFSN